MLAHLVSTLALLMALHQPLLTRCACPTHPFRAPCGLFTTTRRNVRCGPQAVCAIPRLMVPCMAPKLDQHPERQQLECLAIAWLLARHSPYLVAPHALLRPHYAELHSSRHTGNRIPELDAALQGPGEPMAKAVALPWDSAAPRIGDCARRDAQQCTEGRMHPNASGRHTCSRTCGTCPCKLLSSGTARLCCYFLRKLSWHQWSHSARTHLH